MILPHLIKKKAFKDYVSSLEYPDDITTFDDSFDATQDKFISVLIRSAKWLGTQCFVNPAARTVKKRLIFRILNYMIKSNMYSPEIFINLYSINSNNYKDKIRALQDKLHDGIILRFQYLKAFRQLRNTDIIERLNEQFSLNATCNVDLHYSPIDYEVILNHYDILERTQKYEGRVAVGNLSYTNLHILMRNLSKQALDVYNIVYTDDQLRGIWIKRSEFILSNSDLKRLGDLICDAYNIAFAQEVKEFRIDNKRKSDRINYTPTQEYSKHDKIRLIAECKLKLSQRETAKKLGLSKSTVIRYWNT